MSIQRQRKKSFLSPQSYVVMTKDGEVFMGLVGGTPQWSYNWEQAKPLEKQNTSWLLRQYPGTELIKEEELI